MSSPDYLIRHALQNAWCSPRQDMQVILKPKRITPAHGVHTSFTHLWGTLTLPTTKDLYHVYQIGQIHPSLLGLFPQRLVWHNLAEVMGLENLIADVYTNSGHHLPRFESWTLVTEERDLLLAVKAQPRIVNLKTEPVYLRLYSNAYFSSDRADAEVDKIECAGIKVTSANQALLFQRRYRDSQLRRGLTTLFVNGVMKADYTPADVVVGDIVEFVYDSTVKAVLDFAIADLPTFDSLLDLKRKYLLHYAGPQVDGESIDYRDDIDVYLVKKRVVNGKELFDGLYFHKNQNDALRMVTHRDYSVAIPYVDGYLGKIADWTNAQHLTVRLHIRRSGYHRPLVHEHHRIKELYKLSEADRVRAMVGIDSTVPVWKAENLENSFYPKLMDAMDNQVTSDLVKDAYGYNAISRLLGDSPLPIEIVNGRRQVTLPGALQTNATIYEYDASGKLMGYYFHTAGVEYTPVNTLAVMIEGIVGRGGLKTPTVFNQRNVVLNPKLNYRYYVAPVVHGVVQHDQWRDVTGDENYVMVTGGNAGWLVSFEEYAVAVRSDENFLAYDRTLSPLNGLLKFSIEEEAVYPDGSSQGLMYIPPGKLELWLNDSALIENLDYFVKWPQVIIVNKQYLVPGNSQKITVRGTGFCQDDMTREAPNEAGFVRYGLLSRNTRFDVRDDKVMRLVVGGKTFHRDALLFSEDDFGLYMDNVPNGAPYVLDDVIVPLRGFVSEDTYSLRAKSVVVDTAIEDYLTLKLPEPSPTAPDPIADKYPIYSPFSSTVMHDLINGLISMEQFKGQYSDYDVSEMLTAYTYILDYDPTQKSIDLNHVMIHPHNLLTETQLDIYQYRFLERAIKIFLQNKVDITRFCSIKPGWL